MFLTALAWSRISMLLSLNGRGAKCPWILNKTFFFFSLNIADPGVNDCCVVFMTVMLPCVPQSAEDQLCVAPYVLM